MKGWRVESRVESRVETRVESRVQVFAVVVLSTLSVELSPM